MLSDGEDTSSLVPFDEVLDLAKRSETAIYTIGLRAQEDAPDQGVQGGGVRAAASWRRRRAAARSSPPRSRIWPAVYAQISDELSSQYTVGYISKNAKRDGAWRRVVVRVDRAGHRGADQAGLLRAGAVRRIEASLDIRQFAEFGEHS